MSDAELTDRDMREELKQKILHTKFDVKTDSGKICGSYFLAGFDDGWDAARANPDPRVEKLVQTGRLAVAAMKGSGNFAQAILAVENFSAALAEWEKGE